MHSGSRGMVGWRLTVGGEMAVESRLMVEDSLRLESWGSCVHKRMGVDWDLVFRIRMGHTLGLLEEGE